MHPPRSAAGFTLLELLVVITIIGILASLLMPGLSTSLEAARRMSCQNNMMQMGYAFSMFADEHDGRFPPGHPNNFWGDPLEDEQREFRRDQLNRRSTDVPETFEGDEDDYPENLIRNNYIFDGAQLYPGYLENLDVLVCPSAVSFRDIDPENYFRDMSFSEERIDPDLFRDDDNRIPINRLQGTRPDPECITDEFYTYLPYALETEENALFLWDMINYLMFTGETDFMDDNLILDADRFESRNERRDAVGEDPDDRFRDNRDRPVSIPGDEFGDRRGFEFESRFGHAPGGGDTWFRTARGVGKMFVRDVNDPGSDFVSESDIPVLFDTVGFDGRVQFPHQPVGGNVLFLDGHVEFQKYRETTTPRSDNFGVWSFFSFSDLPYTTDFVDFLRANVYDNTSRMNVPPWCGNRDEDLDYMPRYWFYPRDELYNELDWDEPTDPFAGF